MISELHKLSRSNVDLEHDMEVLAIEHSHSKDLLALKFQLQENLAALGEQSQDCNPPAHPSTLDHRLFPLLQLPYVNEHKTQDLPILPKPVAEDVVTTHIFPVVERTCQSQSHTDSCDFDEVLLPTTLPAVTTTTTTAKSVSRKHARHENRERVTGAGDSFEEISGQQKRQNNSSDEDKDGEYIHIVDFFQARLLQNRPVAQKGSQRNRERISS